MADQTRARKAALDVSHCDGCNLRVLASDEDYEQCLDLQRETWGDDFRELVPPTILAISQKVGGVLAGAFEGERMLGFVYGLTGVRGGERAHWSHMLAVSAEARGRGLGKALKLYQREQLLALNVRSMLWTYDPLIARNAKLNLVALGARPEEYVVNMYGDDTGSALHSGLGTDRFVVRWRLDQEPSPDRDSSGVVLSAGASGGTEWVEIPADIDALKKTDLEEARQWRTKTRESLLDLLGRGYRCGGLRWLDDNRVFYVFEPET